MPEPALLLTQGPGASAEARLLLLCARLDLDEARRDRLREMIEAPLDWQRLLGLAAYHGLGPLLFRHLQATAPERIPRSIYAQLWSRHSLLTRRNQEMAAQLKSLVAALEGQGIAVLPYKGPLLALDAYGDLALREFGDLDLLLRPADILPAKNMLQAMDFHPEVELQPAIEAAFLRSRANYHLVLRREQPVLMVELHWKTDPEFPVEPPDDASWWRDLARRDLDGQPVRGFSPEEQVLVLILHGSKHFWASLGWLVDVAELLRRQARLDWPAILARAKGLRASRRLALGLHLLRDVLDLELPAPVLSWLGTQPEAGLLAGEIAGNLFGDHPLDETAWRRLRLNFRLYESWPERLRHASDVLLSPSLIEWSRWPLPRPLFFLYPVLRLWRLLRRNAGFNDPSR